MFLIPATAEKEAGSDSSSMGSHHDMLGGGRAADKRASLVHRPSHREDLH